MRENDPVWTGPKRARGQMSYLARAPRRSRAPGVDPHMPIRFRCAYCNHLFGIARRKAGTVVRCPTCAGQVVVPSVEAGGGRPEPGNAPLFERSDFDDLFVNAAGAGPGTEPQSGGSAAAAPAAAP